MANSILQTYLTHQFIPVDDESALDKLKKSAEQIGKKLRKEKAKVIHYTLVALDPNVPVDDLVLLEVQEIIIKNWPVFVNKAGGNNLVTYNRAVILEALSDLSGDIEFTSIIWLSGCSVIKHYSLGREESVLRDWLLSIGKEYEIEARRHWAVTDFKLSSALPQLEKVSEEVKTYVTNKDYLKKRLTAAAGPNYLNEQNQTVTEENANPHWANQNTHWQGYFGRIASEAISSTFDSVIKENNKEMISYVGKSNIKLSEYLEKLKPYFENLGNSLLNKSYSLDLRSQLLWIKESQFSANFNASYRELDDITLLFAIAKDLADTIPVLYPVSVDYFAKEIARVSNPKIDDIISIVDLLNQIQTTSTLKELLSEHSEVTGRKNVYTFISSFVNKKIVIDDLKKVTGISPATSISKSEFLVWLLHDIQALKISSSK